MASNTTYTNDSVITRYPSGKVVCKYANGIIHCVDEYKTLTIIHFDRTIMYYADGMINIFESDGTCCSTSPKGTISTID